MKRDYPLKEFKTPHSFETWLSRNHATAEGIRIKIGKKGSAIRSISYAEALAVALCYGWIDSQSKSIDGRWDAAYDSPANAKVPSDLAAALRDSPSTKRFFESLDAKNRYAILHRLMTARKPETRAKRLATFIEMLREGRKLYPD